VRVKVGHIKVRKLVVESSGVEALFFQLIHEGDVERISRPDAYRGAGYYAIERARPLNHPVALVREGAEREGGADCRPLAA